MRGFTVVGAVIVVLLQFGSTASAATTRYVDDDHKQCPQATFTKIQPAIDASSRIDVVRVCAGTYPEQLTLPARAPGLFVASLPALAAHIVPPAAGMVGRLDPEGARHLNLVQVLGDQQRFNGFSLSGVLTPIDPFDACYEAEGIEVEGAAAVVDGDAITGLLSTQCRHDGFPYFVGVEGVLLSGQGAIAERSTVTGTATGVAVKRADGAVVQSNTISGYGADPLIAAYPGILAGDYQRPATHVSIRSNDISATGYGIWLEYADGLVKGNTAHDNGTGILVNDDTSTEINANVLRHNDDDGLRVGSISQYGVGGIIRANDVHYNGRDGIAIYGCDHIYFDCMAPVTSHFVIDHNASGANARYDCFDAYPANDTWSANIGVTDSPATLCSPH